MPEEMISAIEQDYMASYSAAVCDFVARNFPEEFSRRFKSFEECVEAAKKGADLWFDKWKVNYPRGLLTKLSAYK